MKKIFKLLLITILCLPFIVFADGNGPAGPDLYVKVINEKGIYLECTSIEEYEEDYETLDERCGKFLETNTENYNDDDEEEYDYSYSGYMNYFDNLDDYTKCVKEYEYEEKVRNNCKNGAYHVEYGETGILEFTKYYDEFNGFVLYDEEADLSDYAPIEETYNENTENSIKIPAYVFDKQNIYAGPQNKLYKSIGEVKFSNIEIYAIEDEDELYIEDYYNGYNYIEYNDINGFIESGSSYFKVSDYEKYFNEENIEIILGKSIEIKNINDENDKKTLDIATSIDREYLYIGYNFNDAYYFDGTYYGHIKYFSKLNSKEAIFTTYEEFFLVDDLSKNASDIIIPADTTLTSNYYNIDYEDLECYDYFNGSFYVSYNGNNGWINISFDVYDYDDYLVTDNLGLEERFEEIEYEPEETYEITTKKVTDYKTYYLYDTRFAKTNNVIGDKAYININIKEKETSKTYDYNYITGGYAYIKNRSSKIIKAELIKDKKGFYINTDDIKKGTYTLASLMLFIDDVKYIYTSNVSETRYIYYEFPYEVTFKKPVVEETNNTKEKEYSIKDILIYCGIGAGILSLTAVVTIILVNKKKKSKEKNTTQVQNEIITVQSTKVQNNSLNTSVNNENINNQITNNNENNSNQ